MIKKQPFGQTGHMSTKAIFGGAAIRRVTQAEADRVLNLLLKYGINHIDTAASYGNSELRIGPWMKLHRKDFFLATKTGKRKYSEAWEDILNSLKRLQVKSVDLLQLHNLTHPDDWDQAMGEDGALKAAKEAQEQDLTRFIGVTGHGLLTAAMHIRSLKHFEFDSVLLPWNYILSKTDRYKQEFEKLLKICKDRGVAVQTIKSITKGPWAVKERVRSTWYEPLEEQVSINKATSWVLGTGNVFLNTCSDVDLLPKVLEAVDRLEDKPSTAEMEQLVEEEHMSRLFVS
jgi:predicted aldo/keto reductase-like oxidoreductase